jgi:hypothetical protein
MRARTIVWVPLMLASMASADDDAAQEGLRRFFEGHQVVVLLDMPATQSGIDIYPEREYPLEYRQVGDRIGSEGISVRRGERITVTHIKIKDDLIEFQLGGGGFSNFRHGSGSVPVHITPKSSHERDVERRLKSETDEHRRRELRRELDYLRRDREYRDDQNREIAEIANEQRRGRDHERALDLGSRFNIRFEKKDVPEAYKTPEGLMRALEKYVDFMDLGPRPPRRAEDLVPAEPEDAASAHKGMSRAEIETIYGRPRREDESHEGALAVKVAAYELDGERIEVTYVDEVAVRVTPLEPR